MLHFTMITQANLELCHFGIACLHVPFSCIKFQDLKSSNMLEVSMALIFICKLVGSDMIPPLLPMVQEKLLHPKLVLTYVHYMCIVIVLAF